MKPHIRFVLTVGWAVLIPLLNAGAATFQVQVGAGGRKFTPKNITIQPGDTVEWDWAADEHSSTSGTPGNPDGLWNSGVRDSGFVFSRTFSDVGTFSYYCTPHGACCGMVGSVTVATQSSVAGAVFVNANVPRNQVLMYSRGDNGQLTLVGGFSTQGSGSSAGLAAQSSIALANKNKFLYVVNAGSNEITAFQVKRNNLVFVGKVSSGGTFPSSIATFGSLLYVLNAQGTAANISGFLIQPDGSLVAIPNSARPLSAALPSPAQVGFTPDGTTVIVSEKSTSNIDTYAINADGTATGPTVTEGGG